jgi:glycyl-tRNA synthetase
VGSFSDPLVDCKKCRERFRGDSLIEKAGGDPAGKTLAEISGMIRDLKIACPTCGTREFTEARAFNLMFRTFQGVVEESGTAIYLRPETAQGIFTNFKNVMNSLHPKLPFGIAQIGKSFRNEITPGNFTFRTREFEQMEIEFFVEPGTELKWHEHWCAKSRAWFESLGLSGEKLRFREHAKEELSHYSNKTTDVEYLFPFGWGELEGIASRTDFDLSQHQKFSGEDLTYFDQEKNSRFIPYVVEPSFGADRTVLTFLVNAYAEEDLGEGKTRTVLRLHPRLAPIKAAILPLKKNEPRIVEKARALYQTLRKTWNVSYDDTGGIGKLYRRQDEIGTPFCVTIDFETIEKDNAVTVRERDSMAQTRVSLDGIAAWLGDRLS